MRNPPHIRDERQQLGVESYERYPARDPAADALLQQQRAAGIAAKALRRKAYTAGQARGELRQAGLTADERARIAQAKKRKEKRMEAAIAKAAPAVTP